jgi:phosphatidylinositol alpha-1,6-mannosyltransferase
MPNAGGVNHPEPLDIARASCDDRIAVAQILFVSKPIGPPWNDSSKNLARDLAGAMERHAPVLMGRKRAAFRPARGRLEPVYRAHAGGFSPRLADQWSVVRRLAFGARDDLWHFFFAPNRRASKVGRAMTRARGVPSVQTITSIPAPDAPLADVLFADRVVVLSRATERLLAEKGIGGDRVVRIPPCVGEPSADPDSARTAFRLPRGARVVTYPGDLEYGGGAEVMLSARLADPSADWILVFACRAKTAAAKEAEKRLVERARSLLPRSVVRFTGETARIRDLLAASDLVALPSRSLYAKMDYPLVLLEAMALGVPVLVTRGTSAEELADGGSAWLADHDPDAVSAAIRQALADDRARRELAARAFDRVNGELSPARVARAHEALYDSLLRP